MDKIATQPDEMANYNISSPFVPKFEEFYNKYYQKQIENFVNVNPNNSIFEISYIDLENFDFQLADELIEHPELLLDAAELAFQYMAINKSGTNSLHSKIGVTDLPEVNRLDLIENYVKKIGKLVLVEGTIKKRMDRITRLKISTYICIRCGNRILVKQEPYKIVAPIICNCKSRNLELSEDENLTEDYQFLTIKEGKNIKIEITDPYINKLQPGNKVTFCGILDTKIKKSNKIEYILKVNSIKLVN